jgi:galactosamine-6-phosphate isomerase
MKDDGPVSGLRFVVSDGPEGLARRTASAIVDAIRAKPDLLLCLTSGATPTRTYDLVALRGREDPRLFERLRVLKLDEWAGLPMDDPSTCEVHLRQHLIDPLGIPADRYIGFRGDAIALEAECAHIARVLAEQGPIDLCVLGLGLNGHLGLNEPAPELHPGPHVTPLSRASLDHPMVRRARVHVRHGVTLGMGDILRARKVLLLVSGAHKRAAMQRLREPRVSTSFPASLLWLHADATCMCDRDAFADPDPDVA